METEPTGLPDGQAAPRATPRPLHPAVWTVILLGAFFGAQMVAGFAVTFAWVAAGGDPGQLLQDLLRSPAAGSGAGFGRNWTALLLLAAAATSAVVVLPLAVLAHRNRFGDTRGLWGKPSARTLGWGLLGFALVLGVGAALELGLQAVAGAKEQFDGSLQSRLTGLLARPEILALSIPIGGLLAPAAEEFMFRGFFFRVLRERLGQKGGARGAFWGAALLSSLAWAAIHGDVVVFPVILAFGIVLAWVYERSGSIAAPLLAHALQNTTVLVLLAALVSPS